MPFENEHSCRLIPPKRGRNVGTIRMTRQDDESDKDFDVVMQRDNDDAPFEDQALRYDKDNWTEEEARNHCREHEGILCEPAAGEGNGAQTSAQTPQEPDQTNQTPAQQADGDEPVEAIVVDPEAQDSPEPIGFSSADDEIAPEPVALDPNHVIHSEECFRSYMGYWFMVPRIFRESVAAVRSGRAQPIASAQTNVEINITKKGKKEDKAQAASRRSKPFDMANPTTALIVVEGTMMKASSKWGGTSTVAVRRQLRAAAGDAEVDQIVMFWDTPGGHVDGTKELADDIWEIDQNVKPVRSYVSDMCASAGLECASQAREVVANEPALVGSFGTFGILRDVSKMYKMEGVEDTVISTGQLKGFAPGRSIRGAEKRAAAVEIADLQKGFDAQMARGRNFSREQIEELRTGEVWIAKKAKARGLIDRIESFDRFMDRISKGKKRTARARALAIRSRIAREKAEDL
jgi:protease-4